MEEGQKRDIEWSRVHAAVRRLRNDPDFQVFIAELEYIRDLAKQRSYGDLVKADHCALLQETVIQETIDNILVVCDQPLNSVIAKDDELTKTLEEPD